MADEEASEAGRALVALRWKKASKTARKDVNKALNDARWAELRARKAAEAARQSQSGTKPVRSKRTKSK